MTRSLFVITGMSGAGKTTALKALEDIGCEVIDNLPLSLLSSAVSGASETGVPLAVGIDARTRDFNPENYSRACREVSLNPNVSLKTVFLDCDDDKLLRRFTETRRSHPLAKDKGVAEGIAAERRMTAPVRERADIVIDTTDLKASDLRLYVENKLLSKKENDPVLSVMSFSYREGIPREADLVFDVRFLRNPHYVPELRPLTGRDARVAAYISEDEDFEEFFRRLKDFLDPLFPRFLKEGKHYLTIAVGCTGGKHRSVYVAERLYEWLSGRKGYIVTLTHRELDKRAHDQERG